MKNTNYSVKKLHSYVILLSLLLFAMSSKAEIKHYLGAYANGGEWSLWEYASGDYEWTYGGAGGIGALYELQYGQIYNEARLLFQVGLGARYGATSVLVNNIDSYNKSIKGKDSDGDPLTYYYKFNSRQDNYNNLMVQVPLMLGVHYRGFYAMLGAKIGFNINAASKAKTKLNLTTYGISDVTYGNDGKLLEWHNRPDQQFFENETKEYTSNMNFEMVNVDASVEIGGRLGPIYKDIGYDVPERNIEYRLAGFLDFGILGMQKLNTTNPSITIPDAYVNKVGNEMIEGIKTTDIFSSQDYVKSPSAPGHNIIADRVGHNFMVGVKFTVLFQLPEKGQCVLCRDAYRDTPLRSRGNAGMKYDE